MRALRLTSLAVGTITLFVGAASATTLTLDSATQDGFTIAPFQTTNASSCPTPGNNCLVVNDGRSSVLTYSGGPFDLSSFAFNLAGGSDSNALVMTASYAGGGASTHVFDLASGFDRNTAYTLPLYLTNILSLAFSHSGSATARVDDINVAPAAVPLPATGLLLGSVLLGLGAVGRRRRRRMV